MHSCVASKNVNWCHLIWPTLYVNDHNDIVIIVITLYYCIRCFAAPGPKSSAEQPSS